MVQLLIAVVSLKEAVAILSVMTLVQAGQQTKRERGQREREREGRGGGGCERGAERDRQTGKETDRHTHRQRHTERQTDRGITNVLVRNQLGWLVQFSLATYMLGVIKKVHEFMKTRAQ